MSKISEWSTTAASNNSAAPDGAPEGWAPSSVNAWGREIMAQVKRWYLEGFPDFLAGGSIAQAADTDHDITIGKLACMDTTGVEQIHITSALTKQLDATWAVGTNAGGLDTGAAANSTMYYIHAIKDPTNDVSDILFSTAVTKAGLSLPGTYTLSQLIGAFKTDGSANVVGFTWVGDYCRYTGDVLTDISDATITDDTFEAGTVSVPPSCLAHVYGHLSNTTDTESLGRLHIRTPGAADAAIGAESFAIASSSGDFDVIGGTGFVLADASSQIEYAARESAGSATVTISTIGYQMLTRGRGA